jgi:hypothetical protein
MKPRFQCVGTHWMSGFMTSVRPASRDPRLAVSLAAPMGLYM